MSLVGSLEDLGLGEILQIVSLSGKSGVLVLRASEGEGRIVFRAGLIHGALIGSGPSDLLELLIATETLPEFELKELDSRARAGGRSLEALLFEQGLVDPECIEEIRREHIESAVLSMFCWQSGEFSFEIREEAANLDAAELLLSTGLNGQFLALEGARLRDESALKARSVPSPDPAEPAHRVEAESALDPVTLVETVGVDGDGSPVAVAELVEEAQVECTDEPAEAESAVDPRVVSASGAQVARSWESPPSRVAPAAPRPVDGRAPVVVVDPQLTVLEWVKVALSELSPRVHIFQRSEQAIARVRQYVLRSEIPLVVLSTETPPDPVSGASGWAEIAARLRAQVPRIPLLLLASADAPVEPVNERAVPDARVAKPGPGTLRDPRASERREELARALRQAVALVRGDLSAWEPEVSEPADEALRQLKQASARLRDPSFRGEVLRLVLEFASRSFDRVAIFMVREGEASGMAQIGLPGAGGPDDAGLRRLRLPLASTAWFRGVIERRAPRRAAPKDEGDRILVERLGGQAPEEAYVAPIESGERIAALLYADNLLTGRAIGDTSALEIVLHEAGLVLERAVLERALQEAESEDS